MRSLALLAALLTQGADRPKLMTLPEMLKKMEASPVAYSIKTLEQGGPEADPEAMLRELYPRRLEMVEGPRVEVVKGKRVVRPAPCEEAKAELAKAEVVFQSKNYAAAGALYEEAMAKAPRCHLAVAYRGDASFFAGDYAKALADYDRALAIDPDDGAMHFFRSNALARLGRKAEAVEALRWSLALRPRNENVLRVAKAVGAEMGIRVEDVSFTPHGFARKAGEGVDIFADHERMQWLGYAACKGMWLGEPEHRRTQTGDENTTFSSEEEKECLGALLGAYEAFRKGTDKKVHVEPEPQLDRLRAIVEAGDFSPWLIYELASRVDPHIVLRLGPAERQQVFEFVKRRVLVDAKGK